MNIENHLTNFKISKKLYDLGFQKKSIFMREPIKNKVIQYNEEMANYCFPAYLATELLKFIPSSLKGKYRMIYQDVLHEFNVEYEERQDIPIIKNENLANALGEMLIYLIENKLTELPK